MFERLAIPDVFVFAPTRRSDSRGHFVETFSKAWLDAKTGPLDWVQDNQSHSIARGTLRGLHLQAPPHAQAKLVRCLRGAILDVAVDVRAHSATFGRHVAAELSEDNGVQIFVPVGFAHGFVTLTPDAVVAYKVTHAYAPQSERGLLWRDPALAIDWRMPAHEITVNARDDSLPTLKEAAGFGF